MPCASASDDEARLAEAAYVNERHVQRVEAGASNLRVSTVALLARALGTTAAGLITVDEDGDRYHA